MRLRTVVAVSACMTSAIAIASTSPAATNQSRVAGGCQVRANATVTPGLTLKSHRFRYSYTGTLTRCFYTGTGAANGGVISVGRPITIRGRAYQEPIPTGTGTCVVTNAEGYDFARWNNGTQTIVKFRTTSRGGVTRLTGSVIPSLTLDAVHPRAGHPSSATFRTTQFNAQSVAGVLQLHPSDASLCAKPRGVTAATITGTLSHTGITGPSHAKLMRLSSPAFNDTGQLPASATCTGGAISPALRWQNVPTGTRGLELLVIDPGALHGTISHWVVYNIPTATTAFPAGSVPPGAAQGVNSFGTKSYLPPCPLPRGSTHQYVFELFASKRSLKFGHAPTDREVRNALKGNLLATAPLIGNFALAG